MGTQRRRESGNVGKTNAIQGRGYGKRGTKKTEEKESREGGMTKIDEEKREQKKR